MCTQTIQLYAKKTTLTHFKIKLAINYSHTNHTYTIYIYV